MTTNDLELEMDNKMDSAVWHSFEHQIACKLQDSVNSKLWNRIDTSIRDNVDKSCRLTNQLAHNMETDSI